MRVYIETYGCTLNKSDEDIIRSLLSVSEGAFTFEICDKIQDADIVIVNSCSVKRSTEQKIIHRLRTLRKEKKVLVCGCMPHINKWELRALGLSMVGTRSIHRIKEALAAVAAGKTIEIFDEGQKSELPRCFSSSIPIARIPIAEGCTMNCSFCCTKFARGKIKSYNVKQILEWIVQALKCGAKEIQLTAQDVGAYGIDSGISLGALFHSIAAIDGKFKVRIGMVNPAFIGRFPKKIFECEKFYKFLHLPIQSASNDVLESMHRGYKIEKVIDFLSELRANYEFTFETDIIVGYPTEDEQAFMETIQFVKEMVPDVTNISKFAPRPGTEAEKLGQLPTEVVKRRAALASKVCRDVSLANNRKLVGQVKEVLLLEHGKDQTIKGRTKTYKQVVLPHWNAEQLNVGQFVRAKITDASFTSLIGQLASD